MMSHELARKLLSLPDRPVVGSDDDGYYPLNSVKDKQCYVFGGEMYRYSTEDVGRSSLEVWLLTNKNDYNDK